LLNGTLDLRTGILREHRREDLITKLAPLAYNREKNQKASKWKEFVWRFAASDQALVDYLKTALGAALLGKVSGETMFVLHGESGANGKTTLANVLRLVLGSGYVASTPVASLLEGGTGFGGRNDLARLIGVRIVIASEPNKGAKLDETGVKLLTGDDRI